MTGEANATRTSAGALKLSPPEPVPAVRPGEVAGLVPLNDQQKATLETRVAVFVADLIAQDVNSPQFGRRIDQLTQMGRREIAEAAGQSNRFLDRPVRAMDETASVGTDLAELRRTVEDLDPSTRGNLLAPRKLFGIIPFGSKLRGYFDSYRNAQSHIGAILARLQSGKDELLMDNAAIDVERQTLWQALGKLEQMIFMAKRLDAKLETQVEALQAGDPAKAKALSESALFHTRQRTQDLLTQMAVSVQGYLALDLVKKNNIELIKGVDRASTTTVAALRTAVTVAQALTSQKLVLDQITALNTATAKVIDATGGVLRDNAAGIHEQSVSAAVPLEALSRAFRTIYDTMDSIDSFKLQALDNMKQTISALEGEVSKSREYIARAEGQAQGAIEAKNPGLLEALN